MFLYLRDETDVFSAPMRLLHFAPEPAVRRVLERCTTIEYITTDLEMRDVSIRMDVTDMVFRDDVFDCVICSHVLEHVEDDHAAMREIRRILRPSGFALIMVPILRTPGGRTQEDPAVITREDRERAYGQADHVRSYGSDFPERLRDAGLDVSVVRYPEELGRLATERFGLAPSEQLFVCRKSAYPGATFGEPSGVIRTVSPSDGMMRPEAPEHYYKVGLDALRIIQDGLDSTRPRAILDLPSGYGRVLRMLRAAYPTVPITACDSDKQAVEFCVETFSVAGIIADPDPAALSLPTSYDLIWCGSLLTHLPADRSYSVLAKFEQHLESGGLLIFTTHGRLINEMLGVGATTFRLDAARISTLRESYAQDGFGFEPYAQSDGKYGIALASKAWVLRTLHDLTELRVISYREAEWDGRQDVVMCRAR